MLTELRFQVKIHTISNKPRRRKSCKFSPNLFIHFFLLIKTNKNMQYGNDIICKGKITPVIAQRCQYRKTVARPAFFLSSPIDTCKVLSRETGGTIN
jgi:hypothetical protein